MIRCVEDRVSKDQQTNQKRKAYEKPNIRVIELAADEVLAAGCKMSTTGISNYGNSSRCTLPATCYNPGS